MAKSKEFILKRENTGKKCELFYSAKRPALFLFSNEPDNRAAICHRSFKRFFGFGLKPNESKRIRITIEEVK